MIYADDSIMRKGFPATAGSKMLENFIAPFTAEVLTRLDEPAERAVLSEFGLSAPGELPSPLLCNDVFGHVRRQAAKQGLCYLRPTYGTVSRYGLIPTACSMDQIGVAAKTPSEAFALLDKIRCGDDCRPPAAPPRRAAVTPPYADVYDSVLHILAYAEISANISRYDGVKFGFRAEGYTDLDSLYTKTRTEGFGLEAKLSAMMGCLVLSREYYEIYYEKALKIRAAVKSALSFDEYDILELPVESHLAVLCGLPSLTVDGVQLAADAGGEAWLRKAVGL
ncbi:MAG: amidase family protein [Oscillospiraceae bacterium]|nr:amidase family protein [Oscillospiraceae bacterium]